MTELFPGQELDIALMYITKMLRGMDEAYTEAQLECECQDVFDSPPSPLY